MAKIDRFLKLMVEKDASDLHMPCGSTPIIRIHGDLQRVNYHALTNEEMMPMLEEIMPERIARQFKEVKDTDFIYELPGVARFRTNVFEQRLGPSAVFRLIPSKIVTVEELGLPKIVKDFSELSQGLVLVTGPTGCGKSTTLAAIVNLCNQVRRDHIISIEDPVEFVHQNNLCLISQRQVGDHTESFAKALRQALREDPDIILVGEMRDLETIELAITAAETGHLVFGTLHTTSAAKTVDRIIDAFPINQQEQIRTMLAESLKGVVSQILLKRRDIPGRVAAQEILLGTGALANMIRDRKTFQIPSMIQTSRNIGMMTLDQSLAELVRQRKIGAQDALPYATDKKQFQEMMANAAANTMPGRKT